MRGKLTLQQRLILPIILLGVILTVVSFCGARRQFRKRRQTARLLNRQTEV